MNTSQKAALLLLLLLVTIQTGSARSWKETEQAKQYQVKLLLQQYSIVQQAQNGSKQDSIIKKLLKYGEHGYPIAYNRICALCNEGDAKNALISLNSLVKAGFYDFALAEAEPALKVLRKDKRFKAMIKTMKRNFKKGYEPGPPLKGFKTLQEAPAGGLAYRISISPHADEFEPSKLVIWLHPTGASLNSIVEPMAPFFTSRGLALCVFPRKDFNGWTSFDRIRLQKTLEHLKKYKQLKTERPIYWGYSAGGQLALQLWKDNPDSIGGMLLFGTWPVIFNPNGTAYVLNPPQSESPIKAPIYVLIGEKEKGTDLWFKVEQPYTTDGIPLTIRKIKNQGHVWLMNKFEKKRIGKWLDKHFKN